MNEPIIVCGRVFRPEVIEHLNELAAGQPVCSGNTLARETCALLGWYSPDGRPALSSAKVALRKLERRGVLVARKKGSKSHRLRSSGQKLPRVGQVPARVDQVQGLRLHLVSGAADPFHPLWNDLIIAQHPCGDAPLVGTQLRYLIGSDHGWLGAIGFGSAAFALASRDQWIGWSTAARLGHLAEVVGLSRLLIRQEVRCANLVSKVLSLVLRRLPEDWQERYGVRPLLVETFVDRSMFTGRCLCAGNWLRVGCSSGRGRLGPKTAVQTIKDVWVYALDRQARPKLQAQVAPVLTPEPLLASLEQPDWCAHELAGLDLGDQRREKRARNILQARWNQPQASFCGSFSSWSPAKGAYGLIEHRSADISFSSLLEPHSQATQRRMAAEPTVLLPQDTSGLNYTGLRQTEGLGSLGEDKGRGLWLHSLLAFRPDGLPLGVLSAECWGRIAPDTKGPGRNGKSIDEKESLRWVEAFRTAAQAARRMPQTQLVVITDREGDLYELHDATTVGPSNVHLLVRARHDRNLECHQKLWEFMARQPLGQERPLQLPRGHGQPARQATVQVRWSAITISAPRVGCKNSWPALQLWAIWVHEPKPPPGVEALDWMLLTDLPIANAEQAWEKVQWYCRRWGIEEWHRALKNGCGVEHREFKTAEHLKRALAFDLMVAWRVLVCVKLGRTLPQLPASVLYSTDELEVLLAATEKKAPAQPSAQDELERSQSPGGTFGWLPGEKRRRRTGGREHRPRSAPTNGPNLGLAIATTGGGCKMKMRVRCRLPRSLARLGGKARQDRRTLALPCWT
jgi:hypothetical protein